MNKFKYIIILFLINLLFSCTKVESIEVQRLTLKDKNPALYEEYMSSLREYRLSEHKVMLAKVDNKITKPVGAADQLSQMPDSLDYIIFTNIDKLSEATIADMRIIKQLKGQKSLAELNFSNIKKAYKTFMLKEKSKDKATPKVEVVSKTETSPQDEVKDMFLSFLDKQVDSLLAVVGKYNYDGVHLVYSEINLSSLQEKEKKKILEYQKLLFSKIKNFFENNAELTLVFEGTPLNISGEEANFILDKSKFVVIPVYEAVSVEQIDYIVRQNINKNKFSQKIVVGVTMPSLTDLSDKTGYFTSFDSQKEEQLKAIVGASHWVIKSVKDYKKQGVLVARATNDYYNISNVYNNINKAIGIMNPSPLK